MIFLFTWEEKFLLDKQLSKRIKAFIKKYWNNIYIFQEDNINAENIANVYNWWWLFDEKKLIIIKWFPKDSYLKIPSSNLNNLEKFFEANLNNFSKDDIIIFVSYKPDKRTKFYKFLSKNKNVQTKEFKLLNHKQLIKYLVGNYPISSKDSDYIIWKIWTNLYMIDNELNKILTISDKITKELIDKYVITNTQQDTFELLDKINNADNVINILSKLEYIWEDFFKVLWLLYWNLKSIILIKEQQKLWLDNKQISSKLSTHPFVVMKIAKTNYDISKLKKLFNYLIELDNKIKTWEISSDLSYFYLKKFFL